LERSIRGQVHGSAKTCSSIFPTQHILFLTDSTVLKGTRSQCQLTVQMTE